MSLRTRNFREAEHRAALVDGVFSGALARARAAVSAGAPDLNAILRDYLRDALDADRDFRLSAVPGRPMFGGCMDDDRDAVDADLDTLWHLSRDAREALALRETGSVAATVADLMARHGLPEELRQSLAIGILEANVRALDAAERRTLGKEPLIFHPEQAPTASPAAASPPPAPPPKPLVSALVDPFFQRREKRDGATFKQLHLERGTLRLFLEMCGDKSVDAYHRGDVTHFLDTLRLLPNTYGKSPNDKGRSFTEIIAEADAAGKPRLTDRTAQRHLTALSQFFQGAVDAGHLTVAGRTEMVDGHRFREERNARDQRDMFTPQELSALFSSPVWRGRHRFYRDREGAEVIRDGFFWLPILALYHGARLEELADLHRRDIGCDNGTWFLDITDEGGRRLKNGNAKRVVPLHPEVVRLGFLDDVAKAAPQPADPLFPELPHRGKDKRRGVDVSKWFTRYRRKFGLDRAGLSFHSFRHTAITRLSDAIATEQQRRHRDRIMGHSSGGGEGDARYDKGPGLQATAETLALLRYPEVNLSHLNP